MLVAGIVAIFLLAVVVMIGTVARGRAAQGRLSRETRSRDAAAQAPSASTDIEAVASAEGRARSEAAQSATGAGVPAIAGETGVAEWQPIDEEELGVTRRQFLNRANIAIIGLGSLPIFGVSLIAFLYPPSAGGGFGNKVNIGKLSDILAFVKANKAPFYAASARTYVQLYPNDPETLKVATKEYEGNETLMGLDQGYVALWQRCVHLGCRVPWCQSSQWFECPCHGSKYNKVGEKRDGPAPRGLDRFAVEVADGNLIVNTGVIFQGPRVGTDTTGQKPEGPACV